MLFTFSSNANSEVRAIHKTKNEERNERRDLKKTTGPISTYVRTTKNGNVKWGVRHFVGKKYAK